MGSCVHVVAPATKPGGVLLFHRLSDSTIGAVWFHGRVRDGIGWVTDAMATKLCGRRVLHAGLEIGADYCAECVTVFDRSGLSLMVGLIKRE